MLQQFKPAIEKPFFLPKIGTDPPNQNPTEWEKLISEIILKKYATLLSTSKTE